MTDLERCDKSIANKDGDKLMTYNKGRSDKPMSDEERAKAGLCLLTFVAIVISFIYFVVKIAEPHLYIQQVHIREDFSNFSNPNTSIVTHIKFKSPVVSDELNITLYSASSNQNFSPIGYSVVPGFNDGMSTKHREVVVVPSGPSWDEARRKLGQGSTVELRVEMTTTFIYRDECHHCSDIVEREKCHCRGCPNAKPVKVVADFLLDVSGEVARIS